MFHELLDQYILARPDLILFPSMYHGGLMQAYWAYRCRSQRGSAVTELPSGIISPVGCAIAQTSNYTDFVTAKIDLDCAVALSAA